MKCSNCNRGIDRASGLVRSVFIEGFEVLFTVRKLSPGQGNLCEPCADGLAMKAIEQCQQNAMERVEKQMAPLPSHI